MASYQFLNHPNQTRNSFSSEIRHGRSKSQICLTKILHTISAFPPAEISNQPSSIPQLEDSESGMRNQSSALFGNRGFNVDLNIRFQPPAQPVEDSDRELCDTKEIENVNEGNENGENLEVITEEKAIEISEIPSVRVGVFKEFRGEGCLGMLIEAAKLISGDFVENESELEKPNQKNVTRQHELVGESNSSRRQLKRGECCRKELDGDFEEKSPVVRSKRMRNQVLPYKYRDSILDPLIPLSRHRSPTVSTKRRSRSSPVMEKLKRVQLN